MLQPKQISKLLSQALTPANTLGSQPSQNGSRSTLKSTNSNSPLSLSLLSSEGIPLTTVYNSELLGDTGLSPDNLKIFSLLAYNGLSHESGELSNELWSIMQLDKNLKVVIQRLAPSISQENEGNSHTQKALYVVLFYERSFPDSIAKLKVDNVCKVLNDGLQGYF